MTNNTRLVIDTGVIVSAALLPRSVPRRAFDLAMTRGRLLVSEATIRELEDVLRRPKFDKYVAESARLELLGAVVRAAEVIDVTSAISDCRDPKDNKFLELAVDGQAATIITGDDDLLSLHQYRGQIAVITPATVVDSWEPK